MSNLRDPYFAELLDALGRAISDEGLEVMVNVSTLRPNEDVLEAYRSFLSWRLRAFLISADNLRDVPAPPDLLRVLKSTVVITLNANPWSACSAIFPDRAASADMAVDYLLNLGHKRIGVLAYPHEAGHPKRTFLEQSLERRNAAMRESDILQILPGVDGSNPKSGFALGREYFRRADRPTAIVAWTDGIATSFLSGFMCAGGRVPQDLAVVAYNNTDLAATGALPLTVVGVPMERFAKATVELMQRQSAARDRGEDVAVEHVKLAPDLIIRESTAISA
jgi:DNA-binding LacI/PurR family transcriptional regulator